jgi:translation initiation factor IF-2
MAEQQDNNNENKTGRSKLTLKLKPVSSNSPQSLVLKPAEHKKSGLSSVQITIKGRKSLAANNLAKEERISGLSKAEIDDRRRVLTSLPTDDKARKEVKSHQILSKLKKDQDKKIAESQPQKQEVEEKVNEDLIKQDHTTQINNQDIAITEINSDLKEVEPIKEQTIELDLTKKNQEILESKIIAPTRPVINNYQAEGFDVRSKIRQSLEEGNRQREEREKMLEEKKQKEQTKIVEEKLIQDKLEKDKKIKSKKPAKNIFEENEEKARKYKPIQEEKINTRKLTYIVNSGNVDEVDNFYRKKKKYKNKQFNLEAQKEYKKIVREVNLPELISVADLADRMSEKAGDVVKKLFTMGVVTTVNQVIDADTAEIIISEFGHIAKRVSSSDVENILNISEEEVGEKFSRAPIVTIMGHVDHGKTSLLDAIRSTTVAAKEHGGITQHIGASRIKTNKGKFITFLDTPGHEAFTEMRSRGANITDIVVLVVAADDGVKEQTIEAISHAKAANVPIIVAVNKIDKPGADPSRVKQELLSHNIVSEDLGGEVMFVPVSAKQMLNLDKLEEAILLQAEILELSAVHEGRAKGVVLESRIDANKGVVATLLVQSGTLNISDIIVVGTSYGKMRKMLDEKGKNIVIAAPSMPVEILGLDSAPNAGDQFFVVKEEKQARDIISYRSKKDREAKVMKSSAKSFADVFKESGKDKLKYLNVIIKGDVHGSVEAIASSLAKLNTSEVAIKAIHTATGGITETDVSLAAVSGAIIIGFNVRANMAAKEMARVKNVDIRYYSIIYNVVDELKLLLGGMLEPTKNEEYLGQAEIRQVFKLTGVGKIAGSFVTDGLIKRGAKVRLLRNNIVIFDGTLKTLKRFKEDVKEVKGNFECGLSLENYDDIKEGDMIECYQINEEKRSL